MKFGLSDRVALGYIDNVAPRGDFLVLTCWVSPQQVACYPPEPNGDPSHPDWIRMGGVVGEGVDRVSLAPPKMKNCKVLKRILVSNTKKKHTQDPNIGSPLFGLTLPLKWVVSDHPQNSQTWE